ncbi:hypothetical protein OIU81_02850 [Streptomyces sp. NBC_01454]|uniref:LAGLIDADG family homing endonuclease n=1 Tax=Streptomyces sp. NBC_01454 TaxID=2975867 RepID=UPI002E34B49F|nr:LAGLIDADG family homing endonuclease [Streptomyces sp. NBC_01454]
MALMFEDANLYASLSGEVSPYEGEAISIRTFGYPIPLQVTPDQEVLTSEGWQPAAELRPTDWLAFTIPQGDTLDSGLSALLPAPPLSAPRTVSRLSGARLPVSRSALAQHLSDGLSYQQIAELYGRKHRASAFDWALHYGLTRTAHHVLQGDPTNDPDFWRIVGYWLAEGDVTTSRKGGDPNVVRWTFGLDEESYAEDVAAVLGRYDINVNWHAVNGASSLTVRCSSQQLAKFMTQMGHGAHNKRLPSELVLLCETYARELVRGYWAGDGTVTPVGGTMNDGWARIASVSLPLLTAVHQILARLGVASSLMWGVTPTQTRYEVRFPVSSASWLGVPGRKIRQKTVAIEGARLLTKVKALESTQARGQALMLTSALGEVIPHNFALRTMPK